MQLKRLEAYGFKSFADKLEIEFDKGITAIVGPNGSGKSNITDAIRWVLGEQNVRNLRGAKAEDIIFTGSASRRALGVADVSLTFDNSDGQLALDFKEVVVTRRLFRSGESEFYINKAKCRLKDIYDLFADTGLGRDAISVISQNKIDEVLNSKPEERRLLFEETAGITKYRNRKRESLRKLSDTEQNLLRVSDIVQEIENQLEPLAEQAEKTKQHNVLVQELKGCKLTQILHKYETSSAERANGQVKIKELKDEETAFLTKVQVLEADKEQLSKEILDIEASLQKLGEKNHDLGQKFEKNRNEIAILQERLEQGSRSKQRCTIDRNEILQREMEAKQRFEKLVAEKERAKENAAAIEAKLQKKLVAEKSLQEKIQLQTAALRRLQEKAQLKQLEMNEKRQELALLERDLAEVSRQVQEQMALYEVDEKTHQLQQVQLDELQASFAKESGENRVRQQEKKTAESVLATVEDEKQQIDEAMHKLQQQGQSASARLSVLQNLQREYEGFGRAVKSVLKSNASWRGGISGAVAELIHVEKRYVTAIEIALGGSLQNIVTKDTQTAKDAIAFLKKERLGRVTFLPLSTIVVRQPGQDASIRQFGGFIGYANELVQTEAVYKKAVDFLLARTLVVDTINNALELAKKQGYKSRIVTLEGEVLNPGGSMAGGSLAQRDSSFLNRSGEIEQLAENLKKSEAEAVLLQKKNNLLQERCADIEQELEQCQLAEQAGLVKQAEQKIYLEKKQMEIASSIKNMQQLKAKMAELKAKNDEFALRREKMCREIETFQDADLSQKPEVAAVSEILEDLQQDYEDLAKLLVEHKIAKTVAEQAVIHATENQAALATELNRYGQELSKNQTEMASLQAFIETSQQKMVVLEADNELVGQEKSMVLKEHDECYALKMAKLVETQKNETETKQANKQLNEGRNKIHAFELELTKYDFEIEQCVEELMESYELTPEAAKTHKLDLPLAQLQQKIKDFEGEIEELGAVNPNAIEEYEALNKRYTFLQKQSQDLIDAKEYLATIIAEMDTTMAKQFKEAFAQISVYFSEIFVKLFGGGQAKLILTDASDVLASGVEIEVEPPEKKLQNLAVLSGGERALTVIALLFAFLKYRPAPFSVVDEIDAPLDEANVNRFGAFLQEYAQNTQFIVVTHRKGTMEAATVMFGVTVEDAGVSKIVSVRLEDQLN